MKSIIFILGFLTLHTNMEAQNFWKKTNESLIPEREYRTRPIIPTEYAVFSLESNKITAYLQQAPKEFTPNYLQKSVEISLPMPDGSFEEFIAWNSPVMEDELAEKYPSIQTYKGYNKQNPQITARFSLGPNGFHAAIKSGDEQVYIDPYSTEVDDNYIVYHTADHQDPSITAQTLCGTEDIPFHAAEKQKWGKRSFPEGKMEMRKYRLALGCTGEWGAIRGTKEKALADMVVFVDRANLLFEAEIAVRVVLVAKNDLLIYLDGNSDPYTMPEAGLQILGQNTTILNNRVGSNGYDVGHVFSVCYDVGGVAGGNICTSQKGAGVTCHNAASISSGIVLVFNHEVGHQMTASHTFNNCPGQEGQLSPTGFEPGSGSTIMAYPGACGTSNLGAPRDNYYHVASLEQIISYTNLEGADAYVCAEKIDINNFVPQITLPYTSGFYIPKITPFVLKGLATDQNDDKMTYVWEQFDNQGSSPLGEPAGNAPIFRSIKPAASPARYFPNVSRILSGEFDNKQELLPTYGRDLTFRFVVRDNNPLGNAAVWEEIKFKVANDAGPFVITFPTVEQKLVVGKKLKVTWDVAKTDIAPVNCKFVDIYIALDNSLDFDSDKLILVGNRVPNDGEENIIIPNNITTRARIVVKAHENIFFATNLVNSRIDLPTTPGFLTGIKENFKSACLPSDIDFQFTTSGLTGLTEKIQFKVVSGLPNGAVATFANEAVTPGENNTLHLDMAEVKGTADYTMVVRSFVPGIDTIESTIYISVMGTDLDIAAPTLPDNGSEGVGPTQKYYWNPKIDATSYDLQVATSPSFSNDKLVINYTSTDTFYFSNVFLEKATIYYWRVRASNACGDGTWSEIYAFNTESFDCELVKSGELAINISSAGTPSVQTELNFTSSGSISDVNVKNIRLNHQQSSDLNVYLKSPSGKEAELWSSRCPSGAGVNIGLDDQSNDFFSCPIFTGRILRPETTPLNTFNGSNMQGIWTLRVDDVAPGNGGRLINFDLEICSNITLNPPKVSLLDTLRVHPGDSKIITNANILSIDNDNQPSDIKYTLVSLPIKGILTINGTPAKPGDLFTQADINNNVLNYLHNAPDEVDDQFKFVVWDGRGGWDKISTFPIDVDKSYPSYTDNTQKDDRFIVFPNPADDRINVQCADQNTTILNYQLTDISGAVIDQKQGPGNTFSVDLSYVPSGMYILKLNTGSGIISKKVVKR